MPETNPKPDARPLPAPSAAGPMPDSPALETVTDRALAALDELLAVTPEPVRSQARAAFLAGTAMPVLRIGITPVRTLVQLCAYVESEQADVPLVTVVPPAPRAN